MFFSDEETSLLWLVRLGILKNESRCIRCKGSPYIFLVKSKEYPDGFRWVCKRPCKHSATIRHHSLFETTKLALSIVFKLFYKMLMGIWYVISLLSWEYTKTRFIRRTCSRNSGYFFSENTEIFGGVIQTTRIKLLK